MPARHCQCQHQVTTARPTPVWSTTTGALLSGGCCFMAATFSTMVGYGVQRLNGLLIEDGQHRLFQAELGAASYVLQGEQDRLVALGATVIQDGDGESLAGLTIGEGQLSGGRLIVRARGGRAVCGGLFHRHGAGTTAGVNDGRVATVRTSDAFPRPLPLDRRPMGTRSETVDGNRFQLNPAIPTYFDVTTISYRTVVGPPYPTRAAARPVLTHAARAMRLFFRPVAKCRFLGANGCGHG
jgi:hypothetical protein